MAAASNAASAAHPSPRGVRPAKAQATRASFRPKGYFGGILTICNHVTYKEVVR
jgi:hypothetical protein